MPSRRAFLGLLATAPVAVPEMVRAATVTKEAYQFAGLASGGTVDWRIPRRFRDWSDYAPSRIELVEIDPSADFIVYSNGYAAQRWATPNRLYGCYVNSDGEAC